VADNHARTGLGAGLTINSNITGAMHHVTIARNSNEGEFSFASAIAGGGGIALTNSIVSDNTKVFIFENTSCNVTHAGAGNVQWPALNAAGSPELPCATVSFVDPGLGALQDNGGFTPTILPATLAVIGSVNGCPATDQRGLPRAEPCTPGSTEPAYLGYFVADAR